MANLASLLKSEISRLARREIRLAIEPLKRASAAHRSEIAALKKQVRQLKAELASARRSAKRSSAEQQSSPEPNLRFRASTLKAHRAKLGVSAKDYGLLLGASTLSVYKWEDGKATPRASMLAKIAPVLQLGKREAMAKLSALRPRASG
jgi:DNA-binding transcriptional regulator YiaG